MDLESTGLNPVFAAWVITGGDPRRKGYAADFAEWARLARRHHANAPGNVDFVEWLSNLAQHARPNQTGLASIDFDQSE